MQEQQRSDRDTYICCDCMKLTDYLTALARARETDPSVTTAELCNDVNIAAKWAIKRNVRWQYIGIVRSMTRGLR
jgi:glutaredoxin-related protein